MILAPMTGERGERASKQASAVQKAKRAKDDIKTRVGTWGSLPEHTNSSHCEELQQQSTLAPAMSSLSDASREQHVKQALTRFVRNKAKPEELETLRYNLVVARVMAGLTAVEAAERFGYQRACGRH